MSIDTISVFDLIKNDYHRVVYKNTQCFVLDGNQAKTVINKECQSFHKAYARNSKSKTLVLKWSTALYKEMSSYQLKKNIPFNKCQFLMNVCIRMNIIHTFLHCCRIESTIWSDRSRP